MDYKSITMKLRSARLLRGERPCVVTVPKNNGKIYSGKKDELYIMTLTSDRMLYFHGLTKWFKDYDPKRDFKIKIDGLVAYTVENKTKNVKEYTFSSKNGGLYFPIRVIHSAKGTHETDVNMEYVLRKLYSYGIKEDKLYDK